MSSQLETFLGGMGTDPPERDRRGPHGLELPNWLTAQEHSGVILETKEKIKRTLSVRINTAWAPPNMAAVVIP